MLMLDFCCFKRKVKHSMVKYLKSHGWPERQHCKSVMIPSLVNFLSQKINFIITGKSPPHIILNSLFKQLFHSSDLLFNPECWGSEHSTPRLVSLTFQETAENSCSTGIKCSEFFSPLLLREGVRPSWPSLKTGYCALFPKRCLCLEEWGALVPEDIGESQQRSADFFPISCPLI